MARGNRFSAVKEQMAANLEGADDDAEIKNRATDDADEERDEISVEKPKAQQETKMTRKTMTIPVVLDVAVKELKDSRNLGRQKGTSKTTEDDILAEALRYFFARKGEFKDALETAENKVSKYG